MIVTFDALPRYRGVVAMVDGAFDPLHAGHIVYFQAAAALGWPLLCNVAADPYVCTKHVPLLPEDQRIAVVDALRDISFTHLNRHDTATVLEHLRPSVYIKGRDWEGRLPARQVGLCARLGIQMVFVDTVCESSTRLLEDAMRVATSRAQVGGSIGD